METLCLLRTRANSVRPRFNRDFTVPSGTFSTWAISRYSISSRSRRITASRNSGESFGNPNCRISLASLPDNNPSARLEAVPVSSKHRKLVLDGIGNAVQLRPPVVIDQEVARQPGEPGGEGALTGAVAPQVTEDAQEDLLREILGLAVVSGEAVAHGVDPLGVGLGHFLPGGFVPPQATCD